MTNHERFKSAYKNVKMPDNLQQNLKEMEEMENNGKAIKRTAFIPALLAAAVILAGSGTVCYAADLGGFRTTVNMWINGNKTPAELTEEQPGQFTVRYTDNSGEEQTIGGGGVVIDGNNNERPATADEYLSQLNENPNVEKTDDGKWILYYKDQKVDITDRFVDGYCHVVLENSETGKKIYCTISEDGSYSTSPNGFIK